MLRFFYSLLCSDIQGNDKNLHNTFAAPYSATKITCGWTWYKITSALFTVDDALINALAFIATNVFLRKLMHHGEKNSKDLICCLKSFKRQKITRTMKQLEFINKRVRKKIKWEYTLAMLTKECLSTIKYLQNN